MPEYTIISTESDFDTIFNLITRVYEKDGYVTSKEALKSGIGTYLQLPSTRVFAAQYNGQIVGTISLVHTTQSSIPMYQIFEEEIDARRAQFGHFGEVCQFAIDKELLRNIHNIRDIEVSIGLLGLVVRYAITNNFNTLCFAVNPKHAPFYTTIGCESFGEEKLYPSVNHAPARAYFLDIQKVVTCMNSGEESWIYQEMARKIYPEHLFQNTHHN